jgi:sRNA-binding regulator protein Hfq
VNCDGASIGRVFLNNGFVAQGKVRLLGTTINGVLVCSGGRFEHAGRDALNCDSASIGGSVFLDNDFQAQGEVRLARAILNGDLSCSGGRFKNVGGTALNCDRASISGYIFLNNGFVAQGMVWLLGATTNGDLTCSGGHFENTGQDALIAQSAVVQGSMFFDKAFWTDGKINLWGIDVRRGLSFQGAVFEGGGNGLDATNATIGGPFRWKNVTLGPKTILHLSHAKVGLLDDTKGSWPKAGNLLLDEFMYEGIVGVPLNAQKRKAWVTDRLNWLGRQAPGYFSLQPYEQLSSILRRAGHEADAKHVLYKKQELLRQRSGLNIVGRCWRWLLKWSIGYGYYAHWAFYWALGFMILGTFIFGYGQQQGMWLSTQTPPQPFYAPVYSLDTLLPIIDFHQESAWVPQDARVIGYWLPVYFWFHIAMGWLLTTLGVLGFTGLVRSE